MSSLLVPYSCWVLGSVIDSLVCACVSSLRGMLGFDMVKRGAYNIPLISGWMSRGILFRIRLTFPLTRSIPSLWNRCWIVIESSPHVALARVAPSFFKCLIATSCQAPKTSTGRGTKFMPSLTCWSIRVPLCLVCLLYSVTRILRWSFYIIPP